MGARQVGKTTLLKQIRDYIWSTKKTYFLNLEDIDVKKLLNTHPNKLFDITGSNSKDKQVIFIDEVQYLEDPANFLKYIYDEYKDTIKLIVSGSSSFYIDQKFKDSLIGRKKVYDIYTLDFEEFLDFKDENEIKNILFTNNNIPTLYESKVSQLWSEYITYWWYPEIVLFDDIDKKQERLIEFTIDYVKKDIYDSNIADSDKFLSILKVLSEQTWELLNINEIANTFNIDFKTAERYIYIMQKSFFISISKPFYTNPRSELSKMPKVYFYDIWFRNALIRNFDPIIQRSDRWQLLENIVWREFIFKYKIENVKYWRTQSKNEVDFIINDKEAYEVKFTKELIKKSKYTIFNEKYPNIDLKYITFENIIQDVVK